MMMVTLLSWLGYIFMAIMMSVPCPLELKVLLVISSAVILVSGWL